MNKAQIQKIIGGVAVLGSIVGGTFMLSNDTQDHERKQMRAGLIEKADNKNITYFEYLHLVNEYNFEIQKLNEKGEKLSPANKNDTIIKMLNDKILE